MKTLLGWLAVAVVVLVPVGLLSDGDSAQSHPAPAAVTDYNDHATLEAAVKLEADIGLSVSQPGVTVNVTCIEAGEHHYACQARSTHGDVANQDMVVSADGTSFVAAN